MDKGEVAEAIITEDAEVRTLVEQGRERAEGILTREGATLEAMVKMLQEKEVIDGEQARGILEAAGRESSP